MDIKLPDSAKMLKSLKNVLLTLVGTFVTAIGVGFFIVPYDLVTGGVSGLSIALRRLFLPVPFFGELEVEVYVAFLNVVLFLLGLIFLGKAFAVKTFISTVFFPIALSITTAISGSDFLGGFFNLLSDKYTAYGQVAILIAAVFGGAVVGAGCALTYLGGGSTGGLDIIAIILNKFFKMKTAVGIFIFDAAVVILGVIVIDNLVLSLLGIVSAFVCAMSVDRLFLGESQAFVAHIVSDKYEEINRAMVNRLHRTSTIIDAKGGFSGQPKKMLMVTFLVRQYVEFSAIVSSIDKNAFIMVHRAHQIGGEGWTYEPHQRGYLAEPGEETPAAETDND